MRGRCFYAFIEQSQCAFKHWRRLMSKQSSFWFIGSFSCCEQESHRKISGLPSGTKIIKYDCGSKRRSKNTLEQHPGVGSILLQLWSLIWGTNKKGHGQQEKWEFGCWCLMIYLNQFSLGQQLTFSKRYSKIFIWSDNILTAGCFCITFASGAEKGVIS